ncbi:DUF1565 domain-containing protein [Paenibacillus sp. S-38]|uniref:DUF1565 domain-containing protein n=1 Tax=Paenibacillus sp. S-38 TaxID=3416710 RepID=UPI003CEA327C
MRTWKQSLLTGIVTALIMSAAGEIKTPPVLAAAKLYYVSVSGKDTNTGSLQSPWKTLQHAANTVEPGSTVFIRGGVYKQKLKITRSGSKSAGDITFAGYPNETAAIDGTGLNVNGQEGLIELKDASFITIKGLVVRNFTTSKRDQVPIGIFVHGSGSDIRLTGNKVYSIKNTASVGSDLSGRDAHGIAVYGTRAPAAISRLTIDGNELYQLVLGSSESLAINGNVEHFTVTNNLIHDNDNIGIDLIGFEGVSPEEPYDQVRNGIVSGNKVYNISTNYNPSYGRKLPNKSNAAGGIYIDGGRDSVIERNYSYGNDIGIELASEHAGKETRGIKVHSNVVYGNRYTGIALGGYDDARGAAVKNSIINNTLYNNNTLNDGSGQILLQHDTRGNVIANNILYSGKSDVLIYNEYKTNSGNIVDYNLYFGPFGAEDSIWYWKNVEYTGLQNYRKQTGNDRHSLFADPRFVNLRKSDFYLTPLSPAVDAGMTDGSFSNMLDIDGKDRLKGSAVNIGADE